MIQQFSTLVKLNFYFYIKIPYNTLMQPWKTLNKKTLIADNFLEVDVEQCQKSNGELIEKYYRVKRPDVAVIAALTPDKQLILVKQYRQPVREIDLELPAGYIEKADKDLQETALRELLEETGYRPQTTIKLTDAFASAGLLSNSVHFFIGLNCRKIAEQKLDQNEEIDVEIIHFHEAPQKIKNGEIRDMASILGIKLTEEYLQKNE